MDENTREQLIDLNRRFYQTFARQFSATRQRLQPGVQAILNQFSGQETILELGCGNGQLSLELFRRGHQGLYTGLDSNPEFLKIARETVQGSDNFSFVEGNLATTSWGVNLPASDNDLVLAFAVLHHIPSHELRLRTMSLCRELIADGGRFIHSEWQFLNSPRLKSRIQPWDRIGMNPHQVEDGDYLIDWRSGGYGLRYVHLFSQGELEELAAGSGFEITDSFYSDGKEGDLAIYQIWERV